MHVHMRMHMHMHVQMQMRMHMYMHVHVGHGLLLRSHAESEAGLIHSCGGIHRGDGGEMGGHSQG